MSIYSKVVPSLKKGSTVTHTLTIRNDDTWDLHVFGRKLDCSKYSSLRSYLPTIMKEDVLSLLTAIDNLHFCIGHPDHHFVSFLENVKGSKGAAILDNDCDVNVEGCTYQVTVRHVNCELLVNNGGVKCNVCKAYRSALRAMYSHYVKQKSRLCTSPRSHVNLRYLSTPERQKRFKNIKAQAKASSRKLAALESKIRNDMAAKSVELDEQLNQDMATIMDECNGYVEENYPDDSFERLFWEQQRKARQLSSTKQMRWHPMFIRWCLRIKLMSNRAYGAFRSSGLLKLPSERTLRDYSNWMKAKPGFQPEVDKQLLEESELINKVDYQKYVCVVFDEVKIKEGLVYDKEECNLIGFVDLDDINNHLQAFELSLSASKLKLATHMVVFMVRGLFSKLKFPYVQFPCSSLNAHTLYAMVWECVAHLETLGLKVLALTADGASCNRKFFKMHRLKNSKSFPHKTCNLYANEDRPIFFFSDPPHLMKTTRNCWANSFGHTYARKLWVGDTKMQYCNVCLIHY